MAKYQSIVSVLKKRILSGDYALTSFPAVQTLAQEIGVSYVTAQRAVKILQDEGLVVRRPNGKIEVTRKHESEGQSFQVAFLTPTYQSANNEYWRMAINQLAATTHSFVLRPVLYTHWEDPLFIETLDAFDGVFLFPIPKPMPPTARERLKNARRVVVLDGDLTTLGIPSVQPFPPIFVQRLLDHLEKQGHTHIDCFNVQPMDSICEKRIEQWAIWMAAHQFTGKLINEPGTVGTLPYDHAYKIMNRVLDERSFSATALLCITLAAALGATRACYEHGIHVGQDVAIGLVNGEGMAHLSIPSITAIETPDPIPYLVRSLDWMQQGGEQWIGSLLMEPQEVSLVIRESTQTPFTRVTVE